MTLEICATQANDFRFKSPQAYWLILKYHVLMKEQGWSHDPGCYHSITGNTTSLGRPITRGRQLKIIYRRGVGVSYRLIMAANLLIIQYWKLINEKANLSKKSSAVMIRRSWPCPLFNQCRQMSCGYQFSAKQYNITYFYAKHSLLIRILLT